MSSIVSQNALGLDRGTEVHREMGVVKHQVTLNPHWPTGAV